MMDMASYMAGYREGWLDAQAQNMQTGSVGGLPDYIPGAQPLPQPVADVPKKRKPSAYNKRLGKAIKDLTARHKLKSGKWRKGWSQKRMMKAAHKAAKR